MRRIIFFVATITFGITSYANAQNGVAPTPRSITSSALITEDFDTLSNTVASSVLPSGFGFTETGTNSNNTYAVGNGSDATSAAGNTYSFGPTTTNSTDRALGMVQSGSLVPMITGAFTNNTGGILNTFTITYFGETWRTGAISRSDFIDFAFATTSGAVTTASFTGTGFTEFDALDYQSPVNSSPGSNNGNNSPFRASRTGTFNVNVANGETLLIRFRDFDVFGVDDGIGIDDFSLQATFQPVPAPSSAVSLAIGGVVALANVAVRAVHTRRTRRNRTVQ